jgi:hypothetical protein
MANRPARRPRASPDQSSGDVSFADRPRYAKQGSGGFPERDELSHRWPGDPCPRYGPRVTAPTSLPTDAGRIR